MIFVKCRTLVSDPADPRTAIAVKDGVITDLLRPSEVPSDALVADYGDTIAGPGLIDIHCHGAAGSDFADGTMVDILTAASHHQSRGTTTVLATVASCSREETLRAVEAARKASERAACIHGVHLEGPYFSPHWPGCHIPSMLRSPSEAESAELRARRDIIKMVTIAPELPGATDFIREFSGYGTVCSIGHSQATLDQIRAAIDNGLSHATHLFNAMPRASRHDMVLQPGVLESVLLEDDLSADLIGDAIHVGPALVELAYRFKGKRRLALISDALRGVGAGPGDYAFGPRNGMMCRIVESPQVGLVPGSDPLRLASSAITLSDALRILYETTSIPLADLWEMASATPARILGIGKRKGHIAPGYEADILLVDQKLRVVAVYAGGEKVGAETATGQPGPLTPTSPPGRS